MQVVCTIVVTESGSISVEFTGPVRGKEGQMELLRSALEVVSQQK